MGQMRPASAHALEGETPIGGAHGRPPDFPDPQMQGSAVWKQESTDPKALVRAHQVGRPVVAEDARIRPHPWISVGIVTIDPDTCIGSASQLEGKKNIHSPSASSEL